MRRHTVRSAIDSIPSSGSAADHMALPFSSIIPTRKGKPQRCSMSDLFYLETPENWSTCPTPADRKLSQSFPQVPIPSVLHGTIYLHFARTLRNGSAYSTVAPCIWTAASEVARNQSDLNQPTMCPSASHYQNHRSLQLILAFWSSSPGRRDPNRRR